LHFAHSANLSSTTLQNPYGALRQLNQNQMNRQDAENAKKLIVISLRTWRLGGSDSLHFDRQP
jgi:hypothetical protein